MAQYRNPFDELLEEEGKKNQAQRLPAPPSDPVVHVQSHTPPLAKDPPSNMVVLPPPPKTRTLRGHKKAEDTQHQKTSSLDFGLFASPTPAAAAAPSNKDPLFELFGSPAAPPKPQPTVAAPYPPKDLHRSLSVEPSSAPKDLHRSFEPSSAPKELQRSLEPSFELFSSPGKSQPAPNSDDIFAPAKLPKATDRPKEIPTPLLKTPDYASPKHTSAAAAVPPKQGPVKSSLQVVSSEHCRGVFGPKMPPQTAFFKGEEMTFRIHLSGVSFDLTGRCNLQVKFACVKHGGGKRVDHEMSVRKLRTLGQASDVVEVFLAVPVSPELDVGAYALQIFAQDVLDGRTLPFGLNFEVLDWTWGMFQAKLLIDGKRTFPTFYLGQEVQFSAVVTLPPSAKTAIAPEATCEVRDNTGAMLSQVPLKLSVKAHPSASNVFVVFGSFAVARLGDYTMTVIAVHASAADKPLKQILSFKVCGFD